jgi:ribonuclease P protein component
MLNSKNRIKKDREFSRIFRKSEKAFANNLTFRTAPKNGGVVRFGFVISNKIDKRATRRNMLRRKIRAMAREIIPLITSRNDIVVIVNKNYPYPYDFEVIKNDFIAGLKRLRLIK